MKAVFGRVCDEQLVQIGLRHERDDGHDRDMMFGGRFQYFGIGTSPDQAVSIDRVPGRHDDVDFVRVLGEGLYRVRRFDHVEESLGLSRCKGGK